MKFSEARIVKIVKHLCLLIQFLAGNMCATSWKSNQRIIIWSTASLNFRIFFLFGSLRNDDKIISVHNGKFSCFQVFPDMQMTAMFITVPSANESSYCLLFDSYRRWFNRCWVIPCSNRVYIHCSIFKLVKQIYHGKMFFCGLSH